MNLERSLSTLELTALGIILKRGPCVAHAVVSEFAHSQTFAYRSGAGSIYPLLKRLHESGLLKCENKQYTISEDGIEALRSWMLPPFEPTEFSTTLDPIRSRTYFLKLLTPTEIQEFTTNAISGLETLLEQCLKSRAAFTASGDRFSEVAMLGAVRETEARISWMKEVQETLSDPQ